MKRTTRRSNQERVRERLGLVAVALWLGLACQPKNNGTLLVVELDTDITPAPDRIEVDVRPASGKAGSHRFAIGPNRQPPFRLALIPEGEPGVDIEIVARAMSGMQPQVTLAATTRFVAGAARETRLFLSRDCLGMRACPGAEQCVAGGGCVARREVAVLRPLGQPAPDAAVADAPIDRARPMRDANLPSGSWSRAPAPQFMGAFNGVAPISERDVWVVGQGLTGGGFVFRFDGTMFAPVALPPGTRPLMAVWAAGPDDVWAVGQRGTILRRVGAAFAAIPGGTDSELNAVFGTGSNDVWIVGSGRTVLRWNGTALAAAADGVTSDVVAGAAFGSQAWLVGVSGGIYHRKAGDSAWARQGAGVSQAILYGAHAIAANDVWVVGDGTSLHYDGTDWSAFAMPAGTWLAVWGSADNDVWAVGRRSTALGVMAHFDGNSWKEFTIPVAQPLLAIRGLAANDVWSVGKDAILRYR